MGSWVLFSNFQDKNVNFFEKRFLKALFFEAFPDIIIYLLSIYCFLDLNLVCNALDQSSVFKMRFSLNWAKKNRLEVRSLPSPWTTLLYCNARKWTISYLRQPLYGQYRDKQYENQSYRNSIYSNNQQIIFKKRSKWTRRQPQDPKLLLLCVLFCELKVFVEDIDKRVQYQLTKQCIVKKKYFVCTSYHSKIFLLYRAEELIVVYSVSRMSDKHSLCHLLFY